MGIGYIKKYGYQRDSINDVLRDGRLRYVASTHKFQIYTRYNFTWVNICIGLLTGLERFLFKSIIPNLGNLSLCLFLSILLFIFSYRIYICATGAHGSNANVLFSEIYTLFTPVKTLQ